MYSTHSDTHVLEDAVQSMSDGPSHCGSHVSSACTSLLSSKSTESDLRKELASHLVDLKTLSCRNEALTTRVQKLEMQLKVSDARLKASDAQLQASDAKLQAHVVIHNLENQELRRQLAEKTGTRKKYKLNTEGRVITPLDASVLFLQQEAERREREAAEEAKNKSKTDAVFSREHQHVLTADTKVFANPLTSYTHKDDILDIVVALGLDHTGTKATLTKRIRTHLASHPDIASQPRFSGLMKAQKSRKRRHRRVDAPSQDQGGPSVSKETT